MLKKLFFLIILSLSLSPKIHSHSPNINILNKTNVSFVSVSEKVKPSVVYIQSEKNIRQNNGYGMTEDDILQYFFGLPQRPNNRENSEQRKRRVSGQGSGFIISDDGYILTNSHVVGNADALKVTLNNGKEYNAKIIGTDPKSDVAVIKINEKNLPFVELGNSDKLLVGEWVLAIGNPFGLSNTLTAGIVSAKGRSNVGITNYENFIQTDAAINPGNSGGPLVNLNGEVIGINTAIFSRSGGYMGIGFAIPINMANTIKNQLITKGKVTRGYLGVIIQDLTTSLASSFMLDSKDGALISDIIKNSPAEKSKLAIGDVVISVDKTPIKNTSEFRNLIALTEPGKKINLTIIRKKYKKIISVTIGSLNNKNKPLPNQTSQLDKLGLDIETITSNTRRKFRLKNQEGVLITKVRPNSPAYNVGLEPGMVITQINNQVVNSKEKFIKIIKRMKKGDIALILIKARGQNYFITLQL